MGVITNNDSGYLMIPLLILLVLLGNKYLENKTCNSTDNGDTITKWAAHRAHSTQ